MPPSRRRIFAIGAISACEPDSTPPVTSLCPLRYLVQLCIDRSMPIDSTGWLIGLAKVLSIADSTPAFLHAAATARTSTQRSVGLIGDSNQTIFVFGPITDPTLASSSIETKRCAMPSFGSRSSMM